MVNGLYPDAECLAGLIGKQEYRIDPVFFGVQVLLLDKGRHAIPFIDQPDVITVQPEVFLDLSHQRNLLPARQFSAIHGSKDRNLRPELIEDRFPLFAAGTEQKNARKGQYY